ncbi:MAG: hypothetical protein K0U93_26620 [Gammaproteobacteria bacterium]|nr:hypothetical protein [Gammaproteobacteria bacterium]
MDQRRREKIDASPSVNEVAAGVLVVSMPLHSLRDRKLSPRCAEHGFVYEPSNLESIEFGHVTRLAGNKTGVHRTER